MKRNKLILGVMLAAMTFGFSGCGRDSGKIADKETVKAGYKKISAEEAKEKMDSDPNVFILDVRTQEEYDQKHIPGAAVIPNETIKKEPLEELPDLDQEILVYCRSGNRSRQAAEKLAEAGYTNVYDFGGISAWPFETE